MGLSSDGTDSRTASAVWDRECLVQVQVADISADYAWGCQAELGVEVRSVEVDLTTGSVDDVRDLLDPRLEDTVR